MESIKTKEEKIKHEKIVKLVEKARKEAMKFIKQNRQLDPQLQLKYS